MLKTWCVGGGHFSEVVIETYMKNLTLRLTN